MRASCFIFSLVSFVALDACAQDAQPWQAYFEQQTHDIRQASAADLAAVTEANWPDTQARWRSELKEMLGLAPWPKPTDLHPTVTGSLNVPGVSIDRMHFQPQPGLYVAANLYKPVGEVPEKGWPAVLYVCGHARVTNEGRLLGNKTGYQHHGLWLARHGVVCLMIDTVQLGELHGEHHGTYQLGRWDWISRGYTPAGVEAYSAIRGVDLLCSFPFVDQQHIGITGRSGGGAYSWFAAALDERIQVAVPVAGITDLQNHIVDGCVEGHCDCMFFVNYFGWDYTKLAALVAPRSLLLANSDNDGIFPLDGVMRIHGALQGHYNILNANHQLGLLITPGPHKDTQELQVGAFKWLLKSLTGVEPVVDAAALKELEPLQLQVFEREIPKQERVSSLSAWFVPQADLVAEGVDISESWQQRWLPELQRLGVLRPTTDEGLTAFELVDSGTVDGRPWQLYSTHASPENESQIRIARIEGSSDQAGVVHLRSWTSDSLKTGLDEETLRLLQSLPDQTHYLIQWRGCGWIEHAATVKQATQVARRFYLLGQTPDWVMLQDFLTAVQWISKQRKESSLELLAAGRTTVLGEIIGLLLKDKVTIATLHLARPTWDAQLAASLPGLLRICQLSDLHAAATKAFPVHALVEEPAASANSELLVDTSREPRQANGIRIVEVDQGSALVWARATRWPLPNLGDLPMVQFKNPAKGTGKQNRDPILPDLEVEGLRYAVPGVSAELRVGYRPGNGAWSYTPWAKVDESTDYSKLFSIQGLEAGSLYSVTVQARGLGTDGIASSIAGKFRTLGPVDQMADFRLAVGTCQDFNDRDGPHGFDVYRTMLDRKTDAFVMAGDVVYYDALARSVPLAYYHWQRTYSLPTLVNFHKQIPTYFLKDDHDTYVNDTWPGTHFQWTGDFTFEDGQRIFREQTGLPDPAYRTFQVSRDLQIWLVEGRDYRSPNNAVDGPEKSIWGAEQKAWLQQTMEASTARYRVVISPTPLVGPDRDNKSDNHSNKVFATEGKEVRKMLASFPNTIAVCGDRHWQYHSIDPETGLHEFSVGPVSERHAGGWKRDDFRPEVHQFLAVAGGYLEIDLTEKQGKSRLTFRLLDVQGHERHHYEME